MEGKELIVQTLQNNCCAFSCFHFGEVSQSTSVKTSLPAEPKGLVCYIVIQEHEHLVEWRGKWLQSHQSFVP